MNAPLPRPAHPSGVATLTRPCPICGTRNGDAPALPYGRDGWDVVACRGCGFAHMPVVPRTEALVDTLAWETQYAREGARRKQRQPILHWLDATTRWRLRLFPRTEGVDLLNRTAPSGPALDLGCGTGSNLARLDTRFVPHGIEISSALAAQAGAYATARGGSVVHASALEGLAAFPDGFFTAALLRSYLEHDWQAREVLAALHAKMAPGGLAAVKVPNYGSWNRRIMGARWCGFRLPDHVNYFDPASLRRLGEETGFTVRIRWRHALPLDDNVLALFQR
ncbi:class I SAM-dependent methyltransferase [Salinarimonas sp. NSM]|uniref:class I SAM-dependent methyltransferase n=1 Tax=Salinarimonas sp. NSM TaxID=3458003 RepID=UPI004036DDBB